MFLMLVLAFIGAVALCLVLIDSLWSVLELVTSYLMPYFLPAEEQSLVKKYGPWAGELEVLTASVLDLAAMFWCYLRGYN